MVSISGKKTQSSRFCKARPAGKHRRAIARDPLVELDRLPHDLDRDGELPLRDAGDLGAVVVRVGVVAADALELARRCARG